MDGQNHRKRAIVAFGMAVIAIAFAVTIYILA